MDSVFQAMETAGDAWSWLVLREVLIDDVRRFDDFRGALGVARSTLAARLEFLMVNGLLERSAAGDYLPTTQGEDLFTPMMMAMRWGERWYPNSRPSHPATHRDCGSPAQPGLRCSECHEVVIATDVTVHGPPERITASLPRRRSPSLDLIQRTRACGLAATMAVIGDRWSSLVVRESFFGTRRFDDFQRNLGIASNILSHRLTRLVEEGVLVRTPYRDRPVRHEYHLTDKGLDLYPIPLALLNWGDRWLASAKPSVTLTHRPCGERLIGVLSCGTCGRSIERGDVIFARPDRQE